MRASRLDRRDAAASTAVSSCRRRKNPELSLGAAGLGVGHRRILLENLAQYVAIAVASFEAAVARILRGSGWVAPLADGDR